MRLPTPYRPESDVVAQRLSALTHALDWASAAHTAAPWVQAVRGNPPPFWAMESLLKEYPISSAEGLALMRLAEALLRVPDAETAIALTADQLGRADFDGAGDKVLARLSSAAISLSKHFLPERANGTQAGEPGLMGKLGARTVVAATLRAVQLLGRQFVLGQTMAEAQHEADSARKRAAKSGGGLRFSYDMLGEGARTADDAQRYLQSYTDAIVSIAARAGSARAIAENDGISIKLSALHPRFEDAQRQRVIAELLPRVWGLCQRAAAANINLTIDAEEVDRLELTLDVLEALIAQVAQHCPQWQGLGLAIQAYQTRALELVAHTIGLARRYQVRLMCRLVKGAYWDAEIKRAQEQGLAHYPVFTHKHHTDISYLACARALLDAPDAIYPQFATHNAATIAAILQMAAKPVSVEPAPSLGGGALRCVSPGLRPPPFTYAEHTATQPDGLDALAGAAVGQQHFPDGPPLGKLAPLGGSDPRSGGAWRPQFAESLKSLGGSAFCAGQGGDRAAGGGHGAERAAAHTLVPHINEGPRFELQRLHGMGEGVYREVLKNPLIRCRVYAPVGAHRDLLAYLVRRLLENGANSSFVHQLADESVGMQDLLISPLRLEPQPSLPLPPDLFGSHGGARKNSTGLDLTVPTLREPLLAALASVAVPVVPEFDAKNVASPHSICAASYQIWSKTDVAERAAILLRAADALQAQLPQFCALLVKEAFKTWGDAVSEVREAVDFLRYYAMEAQRTMQPLVMPQVHGAFAAPPASGWGVTGETNTLQLKGRGVWVCISPWNFPLAIFVGQVAAALATGNTVLAKPAEQTPGVAQAAVNLLHAAGVPTGALQLLHGPGETVGAALVAQSGIAGVVFTGSTAVAKTINRALAAKDGPIVPLIAETGGINAMVVDSSALPEQVVDAVVHSAFRSAGQRCSALRLLCVHEGIADAVIAMLQGAAQELVVGDTADLATDVGPVIDAEAYATIQRHIQRLKSEAKVLLALEKPAQAATKTIANLIAPHAFEVACIADVQAEIFGPVLQVVRWSGDPLGVIAQVNALGYGLTCGVQTRIDSRAQALAAASHAGNVYINRNMIGAVVGVQPFGGEGLSGTGPKAGGPHYLVRFCAEQTVTVNTTAAGGNAALLAGLH